MEIGAAAFCSRLAEAPVQSGSSFSSFWLSAHEWIVITVFVETNIIAACSFKISLGQVGIPCGMFRHENSCRDKLRFITHVFTVVKIDAKFHHDASRAGDVVGTFQDADVKRRLVEFLGYLK